MVAVSGRPSRRSGRGAPFALAIARASVSVLARQRARLRRKSSGFLGLAPQISDAPPGTTAPIRLDLAAQPTETGAVLVERFIGAGRSLVCSTVQRDDAGLAQAAIGVHVWGGASGNRVRLRWGSMLSSASSGHRMLALGGSVDGTCVDRLLPGLQLGQFDRGPEAHLSFPGGATWDGLGGLRAVKGAISVGLAQMPGNASRAVAHRPASSVAGSRHELPTPRAREFADLLSGQEPISLPCVQPAPALLPPEQNLRRGGIAPVPVSTALIHLLSVHVGGTRSNEPARNESTGLDAGLAKSCDSTTASRRKSSTRPEGRDSANERTKRDTASNGRREFPRPARRWSALAVEELPHDFGRVDVWMGKANVVGRLLGG